MRNKLRLAVSGLTFSTSFFMAATMALQSAHGQNPWGTGGKKNPTPPISPVIPGTAGPVGQVIMDSKNLNVSAKGTVTLIRTAQTPKKVKIEKAYAYLAKECSVRANRQMCGTNSFRCGDDSFLRCIPSPRGGQRCYRDRIPRYCCWSEPTCVRWAKVEKSKEKGLEIDFSKGYELWGGAEETFELSTSKAGGGGATFELKVIDSLGAYKIERSKKTLIFGTKNKFKVIALDKKKN